MTTPKPLSRRRFIASAVALATTLELQQAAWALGFDAQVQVCRLAAEQEEGPYYIKDEMLRSGVTEGKPGLPLELRLGLLDARTCKPLSGLAVDIWSCDALGVYSGFTKQKAMGPGGPPGPPPGFNPMRPFNRGGPRGGPGGPPTSHPTDKLTFLRGVQMTGADGRVSFLTIVPGFYMGRTNHIHFRVRTGVDTDGRTLPAGHIAHTGQVFFPEKVAAELMKHPPYSEHAIHRTTQAEDMVFGGQQGALSIATVLPKRSADGSAGYSAELIAAVDLTATPKPAQTHGAGRPAAVLMPS